MKKTKFQKHCLYLALLCWSIAAICSCFLITACTTTRQFYSWQRIKDAPRSTEEFKNPPKYINDFYCIGYATKAFFELKKKYISVSIQYEIGGDMIHRDYISIS